MDIIEKIYEVDSYDEILVIFTVDKMLSMGPKEFTSQDFDEYSGEYTIEEDSMFTIINGDCQAAIKKFYGLEKLIEGD